MEDGMNVRMFDQMLQSARCAPEDMRAEFLRRYAWLAQKL